MKVGLFSLSLFRQVTGIEGVALALAELLHREGHRVVYFCPVGSQAPLRALPAGTDVEHVSFAASAAGILSIRRALERARPEVLVTLTANSVVAHFVPALSGLGIPWIISEHNDPEHYLQRWWALGDDLEERMQTRERVMRLADRVHLLSDLYRSHSASWNQRVKVIPNPGPNWRGTASWSSPGRFISIGRLSEQKRLSLAVDAFYMARTALPGWEYWIVGQGEQREALKSQIRALGLHDQVKLLGHRSDVQALLESSQALLLPSRFEGWPLVGLESLAAGLPIIGCQDCRVLKDQQGEAATLTAPDSEAMANAMKALAHDRNLWQRHHRAALEKREQFTRPEIDAAWLELIAETAASPVRLPPLKTNQSPEIRQDLDAIRRVVESGERKRGIVDRVRAKASFLRSTLKQTVHENPGALTQLMPRSLRHRAIHTLARPLHRLPKSGVTLLSQEGLRIAAIHLAPNLRVAPRIIFAQRRRFAWNDLLDLARSKVVVVEGDLPGHLRMGQKVVQLWHSSGFIKRAANLVDDAPARLGPYDAVVAPSEGMRDLYAKAFGTPLECVYALGSVKTDALIDPSAVQRARKQVMQRMPDLEGKRIYLYAPTFRGYWPDCVYHYSSIELEDLDRRLQPDERVVVILHPSLALLPEAERKRRCNLVVPGNAQRVLSGSQLSLEEAMACASVVVSDYSGVLLDAMAARKPVVCFADDLESYHSQLTPGFVDEVPGLCTTPGAKAFLDAARSASSEGQTYARFRERWVGSCDGRSGLRVSTLLERLIAI